MDDLGKKLKKSFADTAPPPKKAKIEVNESQESSDYDEDEEVQEKINIHDKESQESSDENEALESESLHSSWSKEDKYTLLQAIKFSDSSEIDRIQHMLPSKTSKDISEMIAYYKKKAVNHPMIRNKLKNQRKARNSTSQIPLVQWAKLLAESFNFNELETETATALRLIAEFENIPNQTSTAGVDFRAVYHALANSIEGKLVSDDPKICAILEKCVIETAYASKAFIRNSAFKGVIHDINLSDNEISKFPRPTVNHELAILRHLSSQRRYNPLNIEETYLKPSVHNY